MKISLFRNIKPFNKRLKVFFAIAAVVTAAIFVFVTFFLTPFVKNKITSSVNKSSKGLYTLQMGDFDLKFWSGKVHIKKIVLNQDTVVLAQLQKADPSANLSRIKMKVDELRISSINWQNYLFDRSLEVGKIHIISPHFYIEGHVPSDTVKVSQGSFIESLPSLVASFAGSLKISEITIDSGKFHYNLTSDSGITQQRADNIFIDLKKIRIDTVPKIDVLYASKAHFSLKNYTFITSDSLYKLYIKQFKGSYSDSVLAINSVSFTPLKKDPKGSCFNIQLKSVNAIGINFPLFFKNKKIWLRKIEINEPDINGAYDLTSNSSSGSTSDTSGNKNMLQVALPYVGNSFKIGEVVVTNGKIDSHVKNSKGYVDQKLERLDIRLKQVYISDTTIKNGHYWKHLAVDFSQFESKIQSLNLLLKINALHGSTEEDIVKFENVFMGQLRPNKTGSLLVIENKIKSIKMQHVDFHYLLKQGGLSMKEMYVDGLNLSILQYSDVNNGSSAGKMPNELIKTIPVYMRIDNLVVQNSYVIYKDKSSKVKNDGQITFEQTNLRVSNLTNDKRMMTAEHPAELWLQTKIMGDGDLKLNIKMPLLSENFDYSYTGNLGPTNATCFNSMLQYGGMKLEDGKVEAQNFNVEVKDGKAVGAMLLIYHDLHASVIKKQSGKEEKLATGIADIVLKKKNKKHNKLSAKVAKVNYRQKKTDDFLSYTWASISDAIVKTVVKDFFEPFVPKK